MRCEATTQKGEQCRNPTGGVQYCERHRRRPEITTRLNMHLNGGSNYSLRVEDVLLDGEQIEGMSLGTTTDGSPEFVCTGKELVFRGPGKWAEGDEERLDLMDPKVDPEDVEAWILARAGSRRAVGHG